MHFLLFYEVVESFVERREPYRKDHLHHAKQAVDDGNLVLAGALADPADQAVLLFECDDENLVRTFAEQDPYVRQGLVRNWRIRRWNTVIGTAKS